MKKIYFICLFILIMLLSSDVYALDWKVLHEQADKLDLSAAQQLIEDEGENPDNLYALGLVYLNEHKDNQAGDIFRRLISLDNNNAEFIWGSAEVLRRGHKVEESEKLINQVIKINPEFAPAYITLSYIKYLQMKFDESVKAAYKVIKMGKINVDLSNYVRAYSLVAGAKGMIAHYGGPLSKVINGTAVLPYLKKAEALQPDNPGVLFGLGSFYFLAPAIAGGNLEKALDYLERAVKEDPLFSDAYVRLAQAYRMKGDKEKYQTYLNKALEIDPQNTLALDSLSGDCKFICASLKE